MAADEQVFRLLARPFDEDLEAFSDHRPVLLTIDPALNRHDLAPPSLDGSFRDLVAHLESRSSLFVGILKAPHVLEPLLANELFEQLEILFRLAGKACDQRGSQRQPWNPAPQLSEQLEQEARVSPSAHRKQKPVRGVLDRHVDVLGDFRLAGNRVDQLVRKDARIGVVQSNPSHVHLAKSPQKLVQLGATRQVMAEGGEILSDQVQLDRARSGQIRGLGDDVRDRSGALSASQLGDDAEGAGVVAALRNFQVRGEARKRVDPRRLGIVDVFRIGDDLSRRDLRRQQIRDLRVGRGAEEVIHFRHLLRQLRSVALRQAAGDHQRFAAARFLLLRQAKDGVDRFLLRRIDKAARIHHDHVGIRRVRRQLMPGSRKRGSGSPASGNFLMALSFSS